MNDSMKKKFWRITAVILGTFVVVGSLIIYFLFRGHSGQAPDIDPAKRELWKSQAYNYILETDHNNLALYNYTKDSLLPFAYGHMEQDGTVWIDRIHGNVLLNLLMWNPMPIGRFRNGELTDDIGYVKHFDRIAEMPRVSIVSFTKDPVRNFESFWQIFDENYGLFEVHPVDWKRLYDEYRPQVTSRTSAGELKRIFKEMIGKLGDGHTQVIVGMQGISSKTEEDPRTTFYLENAKKMKQNLKDTYFKDGLSSQLEGDIRYGRTQEGIGYLALDTFDYFDMKRVRPALDQVVQSLGDLDRIIVDLRWNGGGSDAFGLDLVSRFAARRTLAYTKTARNHGGYDSFNPPTPIHFEPNEKHFNAKKVIVLTSPSSASAAETTRMAFGELDNVTAVGETTYGVFSDMLFNILPNQWIVTLSGEKYADARGKVFEGTGISPDEEVILDKEDLDAGRDPVMVRAFELLNS
ncbi:MAG: S41 family peptidase [Bacillota bacterium]